MRIPLLITLLALAALATASTALAQDPGYAPADEPIAALRASPNPAYQGQVVVLDAERRGTPTAGR